METGTEWYVNDEPKPDTKASKIKELKAQCRALLLVGTQ